LRRGVEVLVAMDDIAEGVLEWVRWPGEDG